MVDYKINYTDKTKSPIIIKEESVDSSTDITLFGRKKLKYGQDMNQNFLNLLEHFACPESTTNPGTPNLNRANGKLVNPIIGQFWYNSTQKIPMIWDGTNWISLLSQNSIATNWGIISHGQQIPAPVADDGYVFSYNECTWIVGPLSAEGELTDFIIEANQFAIVTATSNLGNLVCNYFIIGIRGNLNSGSLDPLPTITPTPTNSITPTQSSLPINLTNGLVSFWEFEENGTSSGFLDCVGPNNFTRFGVVANDLPAGPPFDANHGKVGKSIRAGTNTYFEVIPTTGASFGIGASYTFGGWFQLNNNFTSFSNLFQRGTFGTVGERSFTLSYTLAPDNLTLYKSHDGNAFESLTVNNSGLKDFGWHFIVAWIDGISLTFNLQIDNEQIFTAPFLFPQTFNVGNFKLGSNTGIPLQAAVDQLFYYNRILNSAERDALYNNGNGVSCLFASGLLTPTPTRTVTPTLTPSATPGILPLGATFTGSYNLFADCLRTGPGTCTATTGPASVTVFNGVGPYTFQWIFVSGSAELETIINSPINFSTTFSRTFESQLDNGTNTNVVGNYRCKVTDSVGNIAFTPILVVTTRHAYI